MSVAPARRAALAVLQRVRERGAFGPETLDAVLNRSSLSAADTAFVTRLAYGTLEVMGTLDDALDRYLERPRDLEPRVRDALRLGAYEILFARTPARAAVNEAVDAVKHARPQASGLANAVLRRLAADAGSFPWGDPDTDDDALARATGNPRWLTDLWVRELGRPTATIALGAGLEPAPLYLLHNPARGSFEDALSALESDGAAPRAVDPPGCILAGSARAAVTGRALSEGLVLVADAAAQIAARVLSPTPGSVVVDVAAGRGTKTAQLQGLAMAAGGPARVHALDIHAFKTALLSERMTALAIPGVLPVTGDATALATVEGLPAPGTADSVLVDAPCTGLGALRRRPEKRWRLEERDGSRLSALQRAMLEQAADLVRVGGLVVYSTCTVSRIENHDVVSGFLDGRAGTFETADLSASIPQEWAADIGPEGWYQSVPRPGGPDGHFVAALRRTV